MALFKTDANKVNITDLTYGISYKGMESYIENLKLELLENVKKKLKDVKGIQNAVDAGWQGEARDQFYKDFGDTIEHVIESLEKEYKALNYRLNELASSYYAQDYDMYRNGGAGTADKH